MKVRELQNYLEKLLDKDAIVTDGYNNHINQIIYSADKNITQEKISTRIVLSWLPTSADIGDIS